MFDLIELMPLLLDWDTERFPVEEIKVFDVIALATVLEPVPLVDEDIEVVLDDPMVLLLPVVV